VFFVRIREGKKGRDEEEKLGPSPSANKGGHLVGREKGRNYKKPREGKDRYAIHHQRFLPDLAA